MSRFGLLFDLDGTLVDSDAVHLAAFAAALKPAGVVVDEAYYRARIAGRPNAQILAEAFPGASVSDIAALSAHKERLYRGGLAQARLIPGAKAMLLWARSEDMLCGLVTTAPRKSVEAVLGAAQIDGLFDHLVVGDEVAHGKPDPLPYLRALEWLGLRPRQAVAFEDSVSGLASAVSAGIPTVALLTSLETWVAERAGAIGTFRDFSDPGVRALITAQRSAAAAV